MRKLIVTEFVSLDGVMEAPGGEAGYPHAGWVMPYFGEKLGMYKFEEQVAADVLVLGRVTYDSFAGAWPQRDDPMADKINSMRKVVASTTLRSSDWDGTTVVSSGLEDAIAEIKREDGGPILIAGSRSVAHQLLAAGLVDQVNLQVFPLVLGSGARFWPDRPEPLKLERVSCEAVDNGVVVLSYAVASAA